MTVKQRITDTRTARSIESTDRELWIQCQPLAPNGGCRGFYLRVTSKSARSYYYRYRVGATGKQRKLKLGDADMFSFADAQEAHLEAFKKVTGEGEDIMGERRRAKRAAEATKGNPETFKALVTQYMKHMESRVAANTHETYWMRFNKHILPKIGSILPSDLTARHVKSARDKIAKLGSVYTADKCLGLIKQTLRYGVNELILPGNVAGELVALGKPAPRTAVLPPDQYSVLWEELEKSRTNPMVGRVIKLLALTGCRRNELVLLTHYEITWGKDGDAILSIPPERSKTNILHRVYLTPYAAEILKEAVKVSRGRKHVFTHKNGTHIGANGVTNRFSTIAREQGWTGLVLHGLRHSCATHLMSLDVDYHITEQILGHRLVGTGGSTYVHTESFGKMRHAWTALSDWLQSHIEGQARPDDRVVALFG